ncbi:hypothetical protein FGF66_05280 [Chlorobaculum thiosulfatiphilum]|uniref:Uncharacterized protein n=1 Tax=Chlorobaculum thiosulfatiphilum TaxID=115852 RepID=A0A5C4S6Q0_CHLTI|nr:hypothetical protein [Chlorobaculum thiosulfatiphilum]TNJ39164.1 hypothetical protein FGF66_05280 [Chlorobaculum thiosulfatiphilum]
MSIGNGDAGKSATNVRIGVMRCKSFVLFWGKVNGVDEGDDMDGRGAELLAGSLQFGGGQWFIFSGEFGVLQSN